jgi:MFS family permease
MIYLISAFVCPIFGIMVDKTGRNLSWMFGATLITLLSHALLAFTTLTPYIAICTIALTFSIWASSLWPIIALIIPEYKLGTAFGL